MRTSRPVALKIASLSTAILMSLFSAIGIQSQSASAAATKTVTFYANDGSGNSTTQSSSTTTTLTPNSFTRSGYSFVSWNTAANGTGTTYLDGASYSFNTDLSLYAQWTLNPTHTVTFNANGGSGSMNSQSSNISTSLTLNAFTRSGYTFANWNTAANGSGTSYSNGATYSFSADLTLYAQWTALPNHTVTFNANGGSGLMTAQTANVSTALTLNSFTRSGYTFSGWNTAANGSGTAYTDGATYPFSADATLYAQWTALPTYVVTFDSNGGSGSMSPQTSYGPTVLSINTFTRSGYSFNGWNTIADGSGKAYSDGGNFPFNADATLYAQWLPLPTHTVTFNSNGGSGSMTAQVSSVSTTLTLNTFTRSGYSFSGWNTLANGSATAYTDGATYSFAADLILYAQWTTLPNHTVTFNSNGGAGLMTAQTANVSTTLTLNSFTRSGYTFANWNMAANGSGTAYLDGATYSFSADLTLYAQWTSLPTFTVTFDANGGSGSMLPQVEFAPSKLNSNSFTRDGYSFKEWNVFADGSGKSYGNESNFPFNESLTLYAQWTADQVAPKDKVIPLTFDLDGSTLNVTVTIPVGVKNGFDPSLKFTTNGTSTAQFPMITITESGGLDDFDKPISIELPNYLPGAKLFYTNGEGAYLPIPKIAIADLVNLCATPKATGYIDNGETITIYTCHLSSFGYRQDQSTLTLAPTKGEITVGETTQLNAGGGSGVSSYIYSTSTSGICSVNSTGLVTAISAGSCVLSVKNLANGTYIEGSSSAVTITVTTAAPVSGGGGGGGGGGASAGGGSAAANVSQPSVTIASAELIIQLTKTTTLTVTGGAGSGVVTYATTTPTICSVTDAGLVTGLLAGECIAKATKAASGTYLEATSPSITITVSDSEKRAADEVAAKAEAEKLALANAAAEAAAAAKAQADAAAAKSAADAAKAEADKLALIAVETELLEEARLAILYKNQITWKKSGKLYAIKFNLSIQYAYRVVSIQVGSKVKGEVKGKLVYKTVNWLALDGNGDGTIKQSKAPVKGSYFRVLLDKKVVYTQLVK